MATFTAAQQALIDTWEAHTDAEFGQKDADAALATMTDHPTLLHVAVGTGASGRDALRRFYAETFIPQVPPDATLELLSRSVTDDHVIDEFVFHFTHTLQMEWLAPGVAATGNPIALPHVAVIAFEGNKIATEHIYWDQASVLQQLGVLDTTIPVLGAEQAVGLQGENPTNELIARFATPRAG